MDKRRGKGRRGNRRETRGKVEFLTGKCGLRRVGNRVRAFIAKLLLSVPSVDPPIIPKTSNEIEP